MPARQPFDLVSFGGPRIKQGAARIDQRRTLANGHTIMIGHRFRCQPVINPIQIKGDQVFDVFLRFHLVASLIRLNPSTETLQPWIMQ